MITIDGSFGEGGGQILRSSLTLSMHTGIPVHITNIRAKRSKPGLMRQHLTATRAATEISNASVDGDEIGSQELMFRPGNVAGGKYTFSVGTAGSTTLVLQTILPVLLTADQSSEITLNGGTHNPMAPPFTFLKHSYLPMVNRMGPVVEANLKRYGFYPAGAGCITISVQPAKRLSGFELLERGEFRGHKAILYSANLPDAIAKRERRELRKRLSWDESCFELVMVKKATGPGNLISRNRV